MSALSFAKYEGLGNDFLVVEASVPLPDDAVRRLCDRHFGVGGDGVLVVAPPTTAGAAATMIVQNADGSRPEMCGNGLRCVALHLGLSRGMSAGAFVVDTDAGPRACELDGDAVSVEMGTARVDAAVTLSLEGRELVFSRVSMGNPHAVTFADLGVSALSRFGPQVATHPAFPEGTNVELASFRPDGSIAVEVWERGVGPTLACGTGACAVAVDACLRGRAALGREITVHLPGGPLTIVVSRDLAVRMRGSARRVFAGEVASW